MVNRRNRRRPLNVRQQKFVEQFLITGIGREAAIRAGYSPNNVGKSVWRLRRLPAVATAIRLGRSAEARRAQVARERVLLELARVAFSDIGEVLDWTSGDDITLRPKAEISPHQRAAIAEIAPRRLGKGPRIKLHNKSHALDALARHLGVFDKVVPAAPKPYERKDGRDARTILLERLARLKRSVASEEEREERAAASLNAGAPLGIPTWENSAVSSPSPRDSGERVGVRGDAAPSSPVAPAPSLVAPAQAGGQEPQVATSALDSRLRRNEGEAATSSPGVPAPPRVVP